MFQNRGEPFAMTIAGGEKLLLDNQIQQDVHDFKLPIEGAVTEDTKLCR